MSRLLSEGYSEPFGPDRPHSTQLVVPFFETHQQLVLRNMASRIGREELAAQLDVPASLLVEWMNGKEMPMHKLLALAALLGKLRAVLDLELVEGLPGGWYLRFRSYWLDAVPQMLSPA
ncbi:MAG TPA: hypothetical protein VLF65_18140, partial [Burkholderiales bacterium]|nr:hypothetical protein [Burkholderiales bacterium]